jgi:hypothetical protein
MESNSEARSQQDSTPAAADETGSAQEGSQDLLPTNEAETFWERWQVVQTAFVDNPRRALEQANDLVGEVMKRLTETFTQEQGSLEGQWTSGEDVTTEEMRVVFQRYRSFFERLLLTGKTGPHT